VFPRELLSENEAYIDAIQNFLRIKTSMAEYVGLGIKRQDKRGQGQGQELE
jgi:hypothetical protein